jgi:hypothetical protein
MIYYYLDQWRSAVLDQFFLVFLKPLVLISAGRLFIVVAVPPGELLAVPLQRLLVQLILKASFANRLLSHLRGRITLVVDTTLFDDERTNQTVLGALEKLHEVILSFVMSVHTSVRPSVRMEQFGSHWTDFHKNQYVRIFRNSAEKIQVSFKSDKNDGYLT